MENESHSIDDILQAARDAATWSNLRWNPANPRSSLRDLEFSPDVFGSNRYYIVNSVVFARRYALRDLDEDSSAYEPRGKVLIYEPDMNVADGLSEGETGGFFDANDCPPWDLWIGLVRDKGRDYVLAWIPESLIGLVNLGAEVNCVDCFYWAENSSEEWARKLVFGPNNSFKADVSGCA